MNISSNDTITAIGPRADAETGRYQQHKPHQQECSVLQPRRTQSLQIGGTTTTTSSSYLDELNRVQSRLNRHRSARESGTTTALSSLSKSKSVNQISNNKQTVPISSSRSVSTLPPRSLVRSSSLRSLPPRYPRCNDSLPNGSLSLTSASPPSITNEASTVQRSSSCGPPSSNQDNKQSSTLLQPTDVISSTKSNAVPPRPSLQRLDSSFRYHTKTKWSTPQSSISSKAFRPQQVAKVPIQTDQLDLTSKALQTFGHEDPPPPARKLSAIQRLILGPEYEPKESRSLGKAFHKELAENLNHETWIEKVIFYTDEEGNKDPPKFFWQSLESGRCYDRPPSGSYRCLYIDDVIIRREKTKPPAPSESKKKRRLFGRKRSKVSTAEKKKSQSADTPVNYKIPEESPKPTTIDNRRAQLKSWKSKSKSSRSLKPIGEDIVVEV